MISLNYILLQLLETERVLNMTFLYNRLLQSRMNCAVNTVFEK